MPPVPTIETDRLTLRPFTPGDLDALAPLFAEESFWRYPLGRGQTRLETEEFLDRTLERYATDGFGEHAVVERSSGALAGYCGLAVPHFLPEVLPAVEVGWRLGAGFRGKGYATEAGAATVRWGFAERDLDRIVSIYEPGNTDSGRVMEKLGFTLDRVTSLPNRELEVHVLVLTIGRWEQLLAGGAWPAPAGAH
ncbi:MAG TPA: GNAT family N-acetyltransferase [Acidimicrobiales bacterium]|nr:GNAT family N-acetyltransferase [Acidimicrobiales bacterium]